VLLSYFDFSCPDNPSPNKGGSSYCTIVWVEYLIDIPLLTVYYLKTAGDAATSVVCFYNKLSCGSGRPICCPSYCCLIDSYILTHCEIIKPSGFGVMEWWNGLEWWTGIEW